MDAGILTYDFAHYKEVLIYIVGFICVLFASDYFGKYLQKHRLPLITGFLILGIFLGPQVVGLIKTEALSSLAFVNDVSLAFIAFAAGAELYIKELRERLRSILWNTLGQLVFTFGLSAFVIYNLSVRVPFMVDLSMGERVAVSLLMAAIFVARSPSSVIAIISEMRAKGPFTKTALGVTVIIDVLVIILFTICFSVAKTLVHGHAFDIRSTIVLLVSLLFSVGFGYLLGKVIVMILRLFSNHIIKAVSLLVVGYLVFALSHYTHDIYVEAIKSRLYFEPLLVCIAASFMVTNRSSYRKDFQEVVERTGPFVYVAFFTLTGVMMSLDVLAEIWSIALILFGVRLVAMVIGSFVGSSLARDEKAHRKLSWMPYVTQAGVGLGLAIEAGGEFAGWGSEFATLVIAVIVLNQLVGPPLMKWSLNMVGESRLKADATHDGVRDAIIIGLEYSSLALARQLMGHGWDVKIATLRKEVNMEKTEGLDIRMIDGINLRALLALEARQTEAIILMLSDEENLKLCELIFERLGTPNVIVRLQERSNFNKFHELGALIVEPTTAIVSLMDHFVRSPGAASLLLGMEEGQESIDIEVGDKALHGVHIRDLKLPSDIIILSVKRKGQMIISQGYTRLRLGDIVTVIGSEDSLEYTRLAFEK